MDKQNINDEIDKLIARGNELIENVKASKSLIVENLSGGMKNLVYGKFNEAEMSVKQFISVLTDAKETTAASAKKSKKLKTPKNASDVWTLLK